MKKTIAIIALLGLAITAQARQTVEVVWPFSLGDTISQPTRATVEEANRIQDKYQFVLINKPGAGASIAAKYVESHPNTILSGSTSFFVRPNFFPDASQNPANFRVLMVQCSAPMMLVSSKYKSLKEISRDQSLTVGISGMGATTHLVATELQKQFPGVVPVPYKSTSEPIADIIESRADMGITFVNTAEQWIREGKMYGLGVTGPRAVINVPTLASQNVQSASEITNTLMFVVPTSMSDSQYQELRDILRRAVAAVAVQDAYKREYCVPVDFNEKQTADWYRDQQELWKKLTKDVKLNK
jgi:tripartite-type tricarboxylate transporter receptor subunit TctC